jgi:hypothetical protein
MSAIPTARLLNGSDSCTLRVRLDSSLDGLHVSSRLLASDLLTTVHETVVEQDLYETKLGRPQLMRGNPLLPESAKTCLDPTGLIRPGTRVTDDAVLALAVRFATADDKDTAPRAPGMGRVTDISVYLPWISAKWGGGKVPLCSPGSCTSQTRR